MTVIFLHGLESGPHGGKYKALTKSFGEDVVISPDCTGITDVASRYRKVCEDLAGVAGPLILVGSSFGGLMALMYAEQHPDKVSAMVLCCPALLPKYQRYWGGLRTPWCPVTIIHGKEDDIVPPQASQSWAEAHGATLVLVEGDHRLSDQNNRLLLEVGFAHVQVEGWSPAM